MPETLQLPNLLQGLQPGKHAASRELARHEVYRPSAVKAANSAPLPLGLHLALVDQLAHDPAEVLASVENSLVSVSELLPGLFVRYESKSLVPGPSTCPSFIDAAATLHARGVRDCRPPRFIFAVS